MATTLLNRYQSDPNVQIVTGVCPHDCPDSCSWQVAVDRATGRALDIWGHPEHPVTAGALCTKVDRYLERTYHRDRLTTPLKRTGAKGEGRFKPVSWDEAIDGIAARLQETITRYGAESVLPYSYAGTMGLLQGEGMAQRFFNRMGASQLARTICSVAGGEGYAYTIGATEGMETEAFARAKLILIWGSNTLTSNMHLWPFVQQAKNAGARVVVIDPARTRTARAAGEWVPLRPGTDAALALAMMHVIIGEGLIDRRLRSALHPRLRRPRRQGRGVDAGTRRRDHRRDRRANSRVGARLRHDPARRHSRQLRLAAPCRRRHGRAHRRLPARAGRRMARPRRRHPVERQRRFPSYGPHRATQAGSAHRRTRPST